MTSRRIQADPAVRAAMLAAAWAQKIGLPAGNLWEPAIARHVLREYEQLGGTPDLWPAIEGIYSARLGINRATSGLDSRITPSEPPPITELITRRETAVREGRLLADFERKDKE